MNAGITIPVWCMIDVEAVLAKVTQVGSFENPVNLGSFQDSDQFVSMVTQTPYVAGGNGTSELEILAPIGAKIQIMGIAIMQPTNNPVYLVGVRPNRPAVCTDFVPEAVSVAGGTIGAMTATVNYSGDFGQDSTPYTGYSIIFQILDPNGASPIPQYYSWDPKITATP